MYCYPVTEWKWKKLVSKLLKRYHTHVCYPVPLCLHGHSSLQGLRWEEGVQVDRLPAKVFKHHYFYLIAFLTQLKLFFFACTLQNSIRWRYTVFSMYLHYHDYLLDGRWVLTPGLDDDDRTALVCLRLLYLSSHFHQRSPFTIRWETLGTVLTMRSVRSGKAGDGRWGRPGHQVWEYLLQALGQSQTHSKVGRKLGNQSQIHSKASFQKWEKACE